MAAAMPTEVPEPVVLLPSALVCALLTLWDATLSKPVEIT